MMLGKTEGKRRRGNWRMKRLDGITDSVDVNLNKRLEVVKDMDVWSAVVYKLTKN